MATKKNEEIKDTITLKIYAKKVETEENTFIAYKTKIGKLNLDVKLTKEYDGEEFATLKDGESGYIKLKVVNLSLDTRKKYPVLWVR